MTDKNDATFLGPTAHSCTWVTSKVRESFLDGLVKLCVPQLLSPVTYSKLQQHTSRLYTHYACKFRQILSMSYSPSTHRPPKKTAVKSPKTAVKSIETRSPQPLPQPIPLSKLSWVGPEARYAVHYCKEGYGYFFWPGFVFCFFIHGSLLLCFFQFLLFLLLCFSASVPFYFYFSSHVFLLLYFFLLLCFSASFLYRLFAFLFLLLYSLWFVYFFASVLVIRILLAIWVLYGSLPLLFSRLLLGCFSSFSLFFFYAVFSFLFWLLLHVMMPLHLGALYLRMRNEYHI
jgi:hypothetical protein